MKHVQLCTASPAGKVRRLALIGVVAAFATVVTVPAPGLASDRQDRHRHGSSAAVVNWNAVASAGLGTDAALSPPVMAVGMAYVEAAVYNAVVGITRRGPMYRWHERGPRGASTDAATAAAARRVLLQYFPVTGARVEAAYSQALDAIPEGPEKVAGLRFGERAGDHLIAQRAGDGWFAAVANTEPPAPGVWRPTPPAQAPYLAPWLGEMTPFTLRSSDQFRPGPPPALTSEEYARDVREVESLGSATSTTRTAQQTEIARFFAGHLSIQLQNAYRDHVVRHGLGASAAARYFAVATIAGADAVIAAWDAKLRYHSWRPVTAINLADTDGNDATEADPTWAPLLVTPPFPEYVSGHTTVIGAVTQALRELDGTRVVDLDMQSPVTGTTRHYETSRTLNDEGIGARIWGGIHFRTADEVGRDVGRDVGRWAFRSFD